MPRTHFLGVSPRRWPWLAATLLVLLSVRPAAAGVVYFQVAERPGLDLHHDSFVLPLSSPADVAHARDLIARGPDDAGAAIAFARIAPGSGGGVNRDLLAPGGPEWSWHVTQFEGFNDFGIELIDGNPTYVEQHLSDWLRETDSRIGFWNYTVVKELTGYPSAPGTAVPLPAALPAGGALLGLLGAGRWFVRRRGRGA